jgi:hypothetical protein
MLRMPRQRGARLVSGNRVGAIPARSSIWSHSETDIAAGFYPAGPSAILGETSAPIVKQTSQRFPKSRVRVQFAVGAPFGSRPFAFWLRSETNITAGFEPASPSLILGGASICAIAVATKAPRGGVGPQRTVKVPRRFRGIAQKQCAR